MGTFLLILHVLVCLVLIFVVLIQSGKGAELGAAFGGSSQTLFGSRGVATFLSKLTTTVAVIFMLTSLFLGVFGVRQHSVVKAPIAHESPITKTMDKDAALPDQGSPIQKEAQPSIPPVQQAIPQQPAAK
ncbi:MAG: preprotein translocase subunit SecG [Nitrospirae bacterium]|nr:preprotein translocase subunit SecG [Nitrospirota bacterium]MBF0541258.1 preprotein translocase subunit SecG [Nitrospirota bacterium]